MQKIGLKDYQRLLPYLGKFKTKVSLICVGALVYGLLRLADPFILRIILDEILVKGSTGTANGEEIFLTIAKACAWIMGIGVLGTIVFSIYSYYSIEVTNKISMRMHKEALEHMQNLDMSYHQNQNSGELMSKIGRGIDSLREILHNDVAKFFLPTIFNILWIFVILFWTNWQMALLAVMFIPPHLYVFVRKTGKIFQEFWEINRRTDHINHRIQEAIANIAAVTSFNAAQAELDYFDKNKEKILDSQMHVAKWWRVLNVSGSIFERLARTTVIAVGGWLVYQHRMTVGEVFMFVAYVSMLYQPLFEMIATVVTMQDSLARTKRLFDLLDIQPKITELPKAEVLLPLRNEITLKNVAFGYGQTRGGIQNINLVIKAGEKVALVGHSGAGKSTLANLIQRYYDPSHGIITFDGTDLRRATLASLHDQITVIPQHTLLFSRTIKENIAYGKEEADDNKVIQAAQVANAHNFIMEKPDGYQTLIGEKGARLSGGQQQRLSIARAVLHDASVIIMDEATSSLDAQSEKEVQEALWKLIEYKTAIIIAHRLATVRNVDRIIVIDQGKIVSQGTHDQLLVHCPLYQNLAALQFQN